MTGYFNETYRDARAAFRAAAARRAAARRAVSRNAAPNASVPDGGAEITTLHNGCGTGPGGEDLCTDVVWIGPLDARRLVFCVSGTHGIEGFCGSAIQTGLLTEGFDEKLNGDTAVLYVHALNPYGFAHARRVNEDNVDLNRNFVDHDRPPANPGYAALHSAIVPADWDGPARRAADAALREHAERHGLRALQAAVTQGQWTHPGGLFYGGTAPVWSHWTLRAIAERFLPGVDRIAYIDLHTGLGARGYGEPIFRGGRDPGAWERARAWYGEALSSSEAGTSSSTPIVGNTASLIADVLRGDQILTAITLEFGTLPGSRVLTALRADNWLHLRPDPAHDPLHDEIKRQIREAFYPGDEEWRAAVWSRAMEVFDQARKGLAA